MTVLRERKTRLTFETDAAVSTWGTTTIPGKAIRKHVRVQRPIVVEPNPFYCRLRLKGTGRSYEVSWQAIWELGAEIAARKAREERKARRAKR